MTKNRRYTDEDWREVSDNPEWTDEKLATAQPLEVLVPELADALMTARARGDTPGKQRVLLHLDKAVVDHFRSTGRGWQDQISEALRKAAGF